MRARAVLPLAILLVMAGCAAPDGTMNPTTEPSFPMTNPSTTSPSNATTPTTNVTSSTTAPTTSPTNTTSSTTSPTTSPTNSTTPTSSTPTQAHVHVSCCQFDPDTMALPHGTTLTYHGHDSGHTVTIHRAEDPTGQFVFDQNLANGGTLTYDFPTAGTYHVFCRPHSDGENGNYGSGMVSTVSAS